MIVVAVCAAVTIAATGARTDIFDTMEARTIFVMNDAGRVAVVLGANDGGERISSDSVSAG